MEDVALEAGADHLGRRFAATLRYEVRDGAVDAARQQGRAAAGAVGQLDLGVFRGVA